MGFNTWNNVACNISEETIKSTADLFVTLGLKDLGYTYVNLDDCWAMKERCKKTGRMVEDPVKFPSGFKHLTAYVHSLDLKIGIYSDSGTKTCGGYPGSYDNEELDAKTFKEWGFDYIKYDNCYANEDRICYFNRRTRNYSL
jgi:alpha-galactosidase